jgi:hypothetical protein
VEIKSSIGIVVLSSDDNLFLDVLREPFCIENSDLSDGT